jgi:hypothetical protein
MKSAVVGQDKDKDLSEEEELLPLILLCHSQKTKEKEER